MPDVFTQFRLKIEKSQLKFATPIHAVQVFPVCPKFEPCPGNEMKSDSSGPSKGFKGGESNAHLHIKQYFERGLVDTYKETRNQLMGLDYSSKFSPWLALGCVSPRSIANQLLEYESKRGQNDGTYWLWFELLWRDFFRFLHFKHGNRLFTSNGLSDKINPSFDESSFQKWSTGQTGQPLVDAGMRELFSTGYLSNRMRQITASYWIHDMGGDWQAGAAWFEMQLIDYDVYSNLGNWLYISGRGADPRGGRVFNVSKQANDFDPSGAYQTMWHNA
jgi:deoxyribodipyrimidine photo-lyase